MHFWAERVEQATLINPGFNLVWPFRGIYTIRKAKGFPFTDVAVFESVWRFCTKYVIFQCLCLIRLVVFLFLAFGFQPASKRLFGFVFRAGNFRKNILFGLHFQPTFFLGGGGGTSFFYERIII